jgi:hypothetical protein
MGTLRTDGSTAIVPKRGDRIGTTLIEAWSYPNRCGYGPSDSNLIAHDWETRSKLPSLLQGLALQDAKGGAGKTVRQFSTARLWSAWLSTWNRPQVAIGSELSDLGGHSRRWPPWDPPDHPGRPRASGAGGQSEPPGRRTATGCDHCCGVALRSDHHPREAAPDRDARHPD